MTATLVSFAEFSNLVSVIAVLLCFLGMILFITRNIMVLRVHGDDLIFPTPLHHVPARIPQMNMMKVHIPFIFKLVDTKSSSYVEIQCSVSSQVKYCLYAYWGVNIRELHICLWKPWLVLRKGFLDGNFLEGHYQSFGTHSNKIPHKDEILTLSLPNTSNIDLGTPPRIYYPLVIFLLRNDEEEDIRPDETVALINVVHIKDSVCTLPTSILAQYLKQANGQLSCLKQLYLATGNPGSYDDEGQAPITIAEPMQTNSGHAIICSDPSISSTPTEQLCVVCQFFPLSRALLPCRHTCICASCFDKLDRCPMCRGPIKSYFCIRAEDYLPRHNNVKNTGTTSYNPFCNWLDSWNDRLVDFLGFQR